jgi:hypothetical protein
MAPDEPTPRAPNGYLIAALTFAACLALILAVALTFDDGR